MLLLLQSKLSSKKKKSPLCKVPVTQGTRCPPLPPHRARGQGLVTEPITVQTVCGHFGIFLDQQLFINTHTSAVTTSNLGPITEICHRCNNKITCCALVSWKEGKDHSVLHLFYFAQLLRQPARYQNAGELSFLHVKLSSSNREETNTRIASQ